MTASMRLVVLGLSISSSWGNGHATTYRALLKALAARGHEILFLERDVPWYRNNRDIADQVYAGLRRTNLDWRAPFLSSWLNNTAVSSKIGLTASTLQPAHAELILEKSYPISRRYMLALDVGFVYEAERAYTGRLSGGSDEFIFVIHPNIQF